MGPPADPYNCEDGFVNWQAGWSVPKKEWCCRIHGKGCPNQGGGGCVTPIATSPPYDCVAGLRIGWQAGVSPRRLGSARIVARVAHQRLVVALDRTPLFVEQACLSRCWRFAPSSGIGQLAFLRTVVM